MKLPKTFVPDKDLSKKIGGLIEKEEMKELAEHYLQLLCGNTTKWRREWLKEKAIGKVIDDTFAGKINWKKGYNSCPGMLETYTAEASVISYEGKEITLPVMFFTFQTDNDTTYYTQGYLHLVNEEGPCINTLNKDVKRLTTEYLKIKLD